MAGKKGRTPQLWATRLAELLYIEIRRGKTLPFEVEGLIREDNGSSIRILQEVGFAKTRLDQDQERWKVEAALKGEPFEVRRPVSWSLKRELREDGKWYFIAGYQTSAGKGRGLGKMESSLEEFLSRKEKEVWSQPGEVPSSLPDYTRPSPSPAQGTSVEEVDACEDLLKKLGY